jgi:acetaldehyde dehydrogenase (acetylating)
MAFATIDLFGVTDPASGFVQETTQTKTAEIASVRDTNGVTKLAVLKGVVTTETVIKGKGTYAPAVAGNNNVTGSAVITSAKISESAEDFPDYEITYQQFASN